MAPDVVADPLVREAIERSLFASLPGPVLDELLQGASLVHLPDRHLIYRAGDEERSGLIVSGMLRQYLANVHGREVTLRYAGPGIFAGAVIVATGPTQSWAQAIMDSSVLMLNVPKVRAIALEHASVAWAIAQEIACTHREILRSMADTAFGSVRQRVARHLLDLVIAESTAAAIREPLPRLMARVSQRELADAVGSVREVVARTLRELHSDGLIDSHRGRIAILDPGRLGAEANFDQHPV